MKSTAFKIVTMLVGLMLPSVSVSASSGIVSNEETVQKLPRQAVS